MGCLPRWDAAKPLSCRFNRWNRYTLNAGGYTALGEKSLARFRAYYVNHDKTGLPCLMIPELTQQRFESTHDNSVYGFFGLADLVTIPTIV